MSSILAIILARKNSKGLKKKNIRKVKGKELIYWPIRAALKSKYIDDVIVSTDCKNIRKLSKKEKTVSALIAILENKFKLASKYLFFNTYNIYIETICCPNITRLVVSILLITSNGT